MKNRLIAFLVAGICMVAVASFANLAAQTSSTTVTFFGGAGNKAFYEALAAGFHEAHPDIVVKVKTEADNAYNAVVMRTISSDDCPDLYGPNDLIRDVKAGLVANLDNYYTKYGWDKKVAKSLLDKVRINSSYIRGSGNLYGAGGSAGSVVGVYYNRELAKKIGMNQVPITLDEFAKYLAAAKKIGLTPIIGAAQDGVINHLMSLLVGDFMGQQKMMDYIYHVKGASLDNPEALSAMTVMADWISKGYFNNDINAVNQQTSYGRFTSGDGVFMFQGSWMLTTLDSTFAGKYGYFPFPKKDASGKYACMMGTMLSVSVPQKSKNKDAAAEYIDWLMSPEAAKIALSFGFLSPDTASIKPVSVTSDVREQMQTGFSLVAADNGFTDWLVGASPTSGNITTNQLQLLFAKKSKPAAVLKAIQKAYENDLKRN